MEAFADAVGLRVTRLGPRMLDGVHAQVQLIVVRFQFAAVFGSTIRQDADDPMSWEAKKGNTRSFNRSAQVMGVLVV